MGLRVKIEGLRFRVSDGKLNATDKSRLIGQRLSNTAVISLRAGDNPADLERIISQRQPIVSTVKIGEVGSASAATEVVPSAVTEHDDGPYYTLDELLDRHRNNLNAWERRDYDVTRLMDEGWLFYENK